RGPGSLQPFEGLLERATGFEPATSTLGRWHSTTELRPLVDGEPLLVQSPSVAFKHNIPLPAVVAALIAAALAALVLFHRPPDEDLLRQAVDKYVATLGSVEEMQLHGNVADIIAGENNRLVDAQFEKKNGEWTYARNLAEEFSKAVTDPEAQTVVRRHLGEKISQRFQSNVEFKEGFGDFHYGLARDAADELVGSVEIAFSYPKVGDNPQRLGRYVESFEWNDGAWRS